MSLHHHKKRKISALGNSGFTLVELVVVIAILAILSAVAIPAFIGVIERAEVEVAKYNLINAFKECFIKISDGKENATYTIPKNFFTFYYGKQTTSFILFLFLCIFFKRFFPVHV